NEINQQIAVELLEGVGAHVTIANNGLEAVEILSKAPQSAFDVVLMDLQMPGMDGCQATSKIRSAPHFGSLPIIAMTAHATMEEKERCIAAGMNDHISKPIDPEILFTTVCKYIKPRDTNRDSRKLVNESEQNGNGQIPVVAGLDTRDGLVRLGGNSELYLKLLRDFLSQLREAPGQVAGALQQGDSETAGRLAHTVKGVAGSLGAGNIQDVAGRLEMALRGKTAASDSSSVLKEFGSIVDDFVNRLEAAFPMKEAGKSQIPAAVAVSSEDAKPIVQEMIQYLDNSDPQASSYLEEQRALFHALLGEDYSAFEQQVGAYAFSDALTLLQSTTKVKSVL
ncbi:MAG TPA: response regulator, partial [Candidatus Kapabacteria bacterium]|nr:response regulator [Candidatus Kapabacteria bacterium]